MPLLLYTFKLLLFQNNLHCYLRWIFFQCALSPEISVPSKWTLRSWIRSKSSEYGWPSNPTMDTLAANASKSTHPPAVLSQWWKQMWGQCSGLFPHTALRTVKTFIQQAWLTVWPCLNKIPQCPTIYWVSAIFNDSCFKFCVLSRAYMNCEAHSKTYHSFTALDSTVHISFVSFPNFTKDFMLIVWYKLRSFIVQWTIWTQNSSLPQLRGNWCNCMVKSNYFDLMKSHITWQTAQ
jgi:hypothetical protein